ncbi:MAG: hypothetical protein QF733_08490 [Phycisphaerales bacterium]|jgi:hypothetical protein|nr:hypothetical protein [Phycisphaerales bacterium]
MYRIDKRHLVLGIGCVAAACAVWAVWPGPEASHAATSTVGGVCVLEPECTQVHLDETAPDQWSLMVRVRWSCPDSHPGVASAVGRLRLSSKSDASVAVELPCRVDVPVSSAAPLLATERAAWDESDPGHRWLRGADPADIQVSFDAEWFRTVRAAGSISGPPQDDANQRSGSGNILQAGTGFRRVDVRTGLTR